MMQEMKDSGIKWIGDIPADWTLLKMKYYSYMKGRIGWQGLTADEFIDEGPYLVTGTDFDNGHVCWDRSYHISEKRYNEAIPIQLQEGDLLVTKDGTIGKLAYIDELPGKASLNSHLLVIRPLGGKYINRFLYWVLSSTVFQGYYELVSDGSTMNSLSQEKIGEFQFYAPPLVEQQAIAAFLDAKCAKLDSIIADLERQIEILQEYKKSVITHAVTKGLNPSAPMKNVNFDFTNSINEHYTITKVKYLCSMFSGDNLTSEDIDSDGDYPVYGGNGLRGYYSDYTNDGEYVIVGRQGALCGNVHIVNGKFWATDHAVVTYSLPNVSDKYLYYLFIVMNFNQYSLASAQPGLAVNTILNLPTCLPPSMDEQKEISLFLDIKCAKANKILSDKQKQLRAMQENKSSLIYEYVTGKKRVKEAAIHAD